MSLKHIKTYMILKVQGINNQISLQLDLYISMGGIQNSFTKMKHKPRPLLEICQVKKVTSSLKNWAASKNYHKCKKNTNFKI